MRSGLADLRLRAGRGPTGAGSPVFNVVWRCAMARSFLIDLGDGRRLTWSGRLVVLLAALTSLVAGGIDLYATEGRYGPLLSVMKAIGDGCLVLGIGWMILGVLGLPFSK